LEQELGLGVWDTNTDTAWNRSSDTDSGRFNPV
jgi:hypothetical protein